MQAERNQVNPAAGGDNEVETGCRLIKDGNLWRRKGIAVWDADDAGVGDETTAERKPATSGLFAISERT